MKTERVELRIDPFTRQQLDDLAHDSQRGVSEIIRRLIAKEYRRRFEAPVEPKEPVSTTSTDSAATPARSTARPRALTPEQQAQGCAAEQMLLEQGIVVAELG